MRNSIQTGFLGLRRSQGGRAWGTVLCLAIVAGYYALFAFGQLVARAAWASASLALWMPNALFFVVALVLLLRESRSVPR